MISTYSITDSLMFIPQKCTMLHPLSSMFLLTVHSTMTPSISLQCSVPTGMPALPPILVYCLSTHVPLWKVSPRSTQAWSIVFYVVS